MPDDTGEAVNTGTWSPAPITRPVSEEKTKLAFSSISPDAETLFMPAGEGNSASAASSPDST